MKFVIQNDFNTDVCIAASKPAVSEPARSVADDGVSSTTASGFISLKVERKRTQSASSAETKPSRKRTSSGLFVVDDAIAQPKKQTEQKAEPPDHGEKIERVEIEKIPSGQKERKDSKKERKKKNESVASKKQKVDYDVPEDVPETNTKCVSAFEESDNWD